jgi:hypothetical protein
VQIDCNSVHRVDSSANSNRPGAQAVKRMNTWWEEGMKKTWREEALQK